MTPTMKRLFFLLKKQSNEKCTKEEKQELAEILERIPNDELDEVLQFIKQNLEFNPLDFEEKEAILDNINSAIDKGSIEKKNQANTNNIYYSIIAAASVLIVIGYFYFAQNPISENTAHHPKSIIVKNEFNEHKIGPTDTLLLLNPSGKKIAKQIGDQLIYYNNEEEGSTVIDTLIVPNGEKFKIQLADKTKIVLNSGTKLVYPESFNNMDKRIVKIEGEAYFKVSKTGKPFIVEGKYSKGIVLGTSFNYMAYPEDDTEEIVLVTGSLKMKEKNSSGREYSSMLKPGEKGTYNKKDGSISKKKIWVTPYTSWMSNDFIFKNKSFEEIMKKAERKYDIKVEIKDKELKEERFNLNFKDPSLKDLLDYFKTIYGIEYKIKGNSVVIGS